MNYSCGLVLSPDRGEVVLVEKRRPDWMAGMLNGVGGAQKPDERRARDTMTRKCAEETGLYVHPDNWTMLAELLCPMDKTRVAFFWTATEMYASCCTVTDERVGIYLVDDLDSRNCAPWLAWLARLAASAPPPGPHELDHVVLLIKPRRKTT